LQPQFVIALSSKLLANRGFTLLLSQPGYGDDERHNTDAHDGQRRHKEGKTLVLINAPSKGKIALEVTLRSPVARCFPCPQLGPFSTGVPSHLRCVALGVAQDPADGRLFSFAIRSACCTLVAQKVSKYRDFLIIPAS
jgi:hypothetical protein